MTYNILTGAGRWFSRFVNRSRAELEDCAVCVHTMTYNILTGAGRWFSRFVNRSRAELEFGIYETVIEYLGPISVRVPYCSSYLCKLLKASDGTNQLIAFLPISNCMEIVIGVL